MTLSQTRRGALLGATAAFGLGVQALTATPVLAQAQTGPAPKPTAKTGASGASSSTTGPITVVGHKAPPMASLSRPAGANQYMLGKGDWGNALIGNNALALVKDAPGVSYTATDQLGVDISDVSLFVRGFHMNKMAVTFEGIPLNDTSFESLAGTSLVNVGVPDAVGAVQIAPGAARESIFSNSDNGGGLVYSLAIPSARPSMSSADLWAKVLVVERLAGTVDRRCIQSAVCLLQHVHKSHDRLVVIHARRTARLVV